LLGYIVEVNKIELSVFFINNPIDGKDSKIISREETVCM
jgi:hypothetical protein